MTKTNKQGKMGQIKKSQKPHTDTEKHAHRKSIKTQLESIIYEKDL